MFNIANYVFVGVCVFLNSNKQLPEMLENEVLVKIAKKYGKTPAQVLLRFINQKGMSVIPKSTTPKRIVENFQVCILLFSFVSIH